MFTTTDDVAKTGIYDVNPDILNVLSADWIIHDEQTNLKLMCHYKNRVYIQYTNKAYEAEEEQLKKDKERDASHNVQNDL